MAVTLFCPNLSCRMVLEVPDKTRGRRVRCSRCGTNFIVPEKAPAKTGVRSPNPVEKSKGVAPRP